MKNTGIVRNIDDAGRIVIPMEIRKTFGLVDDTPMQIFIDGDYIVLKKYETATAKEKFAEFIEFCEENGVRLSPEAIQCLNENLNKAGDRKYEIRR